MVGGNAPVSIDLAPFKTLIRTCAGLMFEEEKRQLLESALAERMAVCALSDAERYLQRLQQDAEEMAHLLDLLTINETYFFREPDQLQLLARQLFTRHRQASPQRPMRVLCLGCSSGEEPYSVALALAEAQGMEALQHIDIMGVDVDRYKIGDVHGALPHRPAVAGGWPCGTGRC